MGLWRDVKWRGVDVRERKRVERRKTDKAHGASEGMENAFASVCDDSCVCLENVLCHAETNTGDGLA